MKTIYVAGPMTGLPEFNYPVFAEAEAKLTAAGFTVESPHHNGGGDTTREWSWYMREGLAQLLRCGAVALLPGWGESRGARLENSVATALGMECRPLEEWLLAVPQ